MEPFISAAARCPIREVRLWIERWSASAHDAGHRFDMRRGDPNRAAAWKGAGTRSRAAGRGGLDCRPWRRRRPRDRPSRDQDDTGRQQRSRSRRHPCYLGRRAPTLLNQDHSVSSRRKSSEPDEISLWQPAVRGRPGRYKRGVRGGLGATRFWDTCTSSLRFLPSGLPTYLSAD